MMPKKFPFNLLHSSLLEIRFLTNSAVELIQAVLRMILCTNVTLYCQISIQDDNRQTFTVSSDTLY